MIETWLIMFQNLKISQRLYCGYLIFCVKNLYSEILTLMQQLILVSGAEEENVIKQRPMCFFVVSTEKAMDVSCVVSRTI